jgi:uncharacterized membrane protein YjfL (UPF0719 family)
VALPLVPLLCLGGFGLLGIIVGMSADSRSSGQAVEWCLGVLAWSMVCCVLGLVVFGCVEVTFRAVEWADNLMETKSDGEARRD